MINTEPTAQPLAFHALERSTFAGGFRDVVPMSGGTPTGHRVFSFLAGDGAYFLKVFHTAARARNEIVALEMLSSIRVPRLCDRGAPSDGHGGWMITSSLPGEGDWVESSPIGRNVFVELGRDMAAMHRTGNSLPFGSLVDAEKQFADWWARTDVALEDGLESLSDLEDVRSSHLVVKLRRRYDALRGRLPALVERGVVHRDLRPANVRVAKEKEWRFVGLIDFEHAIIGDPWFDLSRLCDEVLRDRPGAADAFWSGYDSPGDVAEREARLDLYRVVRYVGGARFAQLASDSALLAHNLGELHSRYAFTRS